MYIDFVETIRTFYFINNINISQTFDRAPSPTYTHTHSKQKPVHLYSRTIQHPNPHTTHITFISVSSYISFCTHFTRTADVLISDISQCWCLTDYGDISLKIVGVIKVMYSFIFCYVLNLVDTNYFGFNIWS